MRHYFSQAFAEGGLSSVFKTVKSIEKCSFIVAYGTGDGKRRFRSYATAAEMIGFVCPGIGDAAASTKGGFDEFDLREAEGAESLAFMMVENRITRKASGRKDNIGEACQNAFQCYISGSRSFNSAISSVISIRGASDHNRSIS